MTQNFDANSTNVTDVRTNEQTNEHTNGRTDERKDENYIPVGINAGGINSIAPDEEQRVLGVPQKFHKEWNALLGLASFSKIVQSY